MGVCYNRDDLVSPAGENFMKKEKIDMSIRKRLLAVVLTLTLLIACAPAVLAAEVQNTAAPAFTDVDASAYYSEGVTYMVENGYMNGVGGTLFAPDGTITRGMVVTILYRMAGTPAAGFQGTFADVTEDAYYGLAVEWAAANGLATGYDNGKFGPDDAVTRQQLAAFLWRYAKFTGADVSVGEDTNILSYTDALSVAEYAVEPMQWACGAGILQGSDGSLLPDAAATRGQFATMIFRFTAPKVKEITVASTTRDGVIPVYVTLPYGYDPAETYPMVILCHGHGGNHNEWGGFDKITNGLARKGIIAVTLDYPGCGISAESFQLNTMTNMKADTLDTLNYVLKNYSADKDNVGIFGYSMGGRITLELLAEERFDFAAVELVAPAEDTEDLKDLFGGKDNWPVLKAEAEEKGYAEWTTIYGQHQELSKAWFADLERYADGLAEAAAAKYTGPSLVIYATNDEAVHPAVSAAVAETMGSQVLNTYADGHSYSFYGSDPHTISTVNGGSISFFTEQLLGK